MSQGFGCIQIYEHKTPILAKLNCPNKRLYIINVDHLNILTWTVHLDSLVGNDIQVDCQNIRYKTIQTNIEHWVE